MLSNVSFSSPVFLAHHAEIRNSTVGAYTSIGRYDKIMEADIGRYCSISWNCTIGAATHPFSTITSSALTYRTQYGVVNKNSSFSEKRTTLGNDVWLGCDVVILAGCSVGNGAVVGSGAVVTKNVPPYEIWAGVPAKKIADRFPKVVTEKLNRLEWWNWSTEEIKECVDLFRLPIDESVVDKLFELHHKKM